MKFAEGERNPWKEENQWSSPREGRRKRWPTHVAHVRKKFMCFVLTLEGNIDCFKGPCGLVLQYDENAVVQLFRLFNMLAVEVCSETGLFRHLTNRIFRSF